MGMEAKKGARDGRDTPSVIVMEVCCAVWRPHGTHAAHPLSGAWVNRGLARLALSGPVGTGSADGQAAVGRN